MPTTRLGSRALRIMLLGLACFAGFFGLVAAGEKGGDAFFDNPWLSSTILGAAGAVVVAAGSAWPLW